MKPKLIKSFLTVVACIALVACLAPPAAQAQSSLQTIYSAGTVPASLSNVPNTVITAPYSKDVAIQIQFALMAAGTSPVNFLFDSSLDNANWKAGTHQLLVTAAGTASVGLVTNFNISAIPYLRLAAVHNTNSAIVTNLIVRANTKRGL